MEEGRMCVIKRVLICYAVVVGMGAVRSEGSPSCCFEVFSNGSAKYTTDANVSEEFEELTWNRDDKPLNNDNEVHEDVLAIGQKWILLNRNYTNMTCRYNGVDNPVQCTDPCEVYLPTEGSGVSVIPIIIPIIILIIILIIIIIIIAIIIWKTGCYRKCRGDAADRPEANTANHAIGGFHAVTQEDQQETST